MDDVIYRASDVALGYGSHAVLRGVNLEIRSGQFWSFLGPNGSGKTTLLRGLLGELKAWAGTLLVPPAIDGVAPIGFVPQRCEINPTLPDYPRRVRRPGAGRHAAKQSGAAGNAWRGCWRLCGCRRWPGRATGPCLAVSGKRAHLSPAPLCGARGVLVMDEAHQQPRRRRRGSGSENSERFLHPVPHRLLVRYPRSGACRALRHPRRPSWPTAVCWPACGRTC